MTLIRLFTLLIAALILMLPVLAAAEPAGTALTDYEPLWSLAEQYGFKLGGCFGMEHMKNQPYLDFISMHFNSLTCCNETKAYSLLNQFMSQASPDGMPAMNFVMVDKMIAFAQEHNIRVRGHVLVWDAYMTDWFFRENYDSAKPYVDQETMRLRLASYIEQVITHFEEQFPGVIYCWDVVNEAIGDNPGEYNATDERHLRTTRGGAPNLFLEHVGEDYVEYSFLCAKNTVEKVNPEIKLFYNDYNMFMPEKRSAACVLVESINSYDTDENGEPRRLIDGIGMQGYLGGYGEQRGCLEDSLITSVRESIEIYASLGLEVQITEMAVRNYEKEKAAEHAAFYGRLFKEAFIPVNSGEEKPLTAVCIWGIADCPQLPHDNYSWKLNSPYGGLITENYEIKTSFDTVYHTLKGDLPE